MSDRHSISAPRSGAVPPPCTSPCPSVEERAYALFDGELPAGDLATLHAHLARCPACRREVERVRRFLAALHRPHLGAVAPASLRGRVCALLAASACAPPVRVAE